MGQEELPPIKKRMFDPCRRCRHIREYHRNADGHTYCNLCECDWFRRRWLRWLAFWRKP